MRNFPEILNAVRNCVYYGFLGGPRILPLRYGVNLFKGFTFIWVIFLMYYFNNYSTGMYLYLFLHGTYGWAWLTKDIFFPDETFKARATFGSYILLSILLLLYWGISLPLAAGISNNDPCWMRIMLCITVYFFGLILMLGSDYQKTMTLKRRKGLISTGFFASTRNPNYLGQIMIYGSFAMAANHWLGWCILLFVWSVLFLTNIYLKDKLSYEKKEGWQAYSKKSYILLPKLFGSDIINYTVYFIAVSTFVYYELQKATSHNPLPLQF